jgi:hypothetical protein
MLADIDAGRVDAFTARAMRDGSILSAWPARMRRMVAAGPGRVPVRRGMRVRRTRRTDALKMADGQPGHRGPNILVAPDRRHGSLPSPAVMKAHEASGADISWCAANISTARRSRCSISSTRPRFSCCRTPRAATPPTRPSARHGSGARPACRTGRNGR